MSYTLQDLQDAFTCDPTTGALTWRVRHGVNASFNTKYAGRPVGCKNGGGYLTTKLTIRGIEHNLQVHRIVWALSGGIPTFPERIDHKNGDTRDNRTANLRPATATTNAQNQRNARSDNQTGVLGVHPVKGKFRASIRVNGKLKHLGYHNTPEAAHAAYLEAKRALHEGCTI